MTDTGRVVPAIEGDRAGRPRVEFWGDWLYHVDVPERAFALPLGIWVTYIMLTVLTWGETSSVPLCSAAGAPRRRPHFATPSPCSRYLTYRPV